MSTRTKSLTGARWNKGFSYLVLSLATFLSLFPLWWMFVVGSNRSEVVNNVPPRLIPGGNFANLASQVFQATPFGRALLNSFIVAISVAISQVVLSTAAGFAFARLRFRGRDVLLTFTVLTMMIPPHLGVVPMFLLIADIGWVSSLRAVIVPNIVTAFGVFWMRQLIAGSVPSELVEAARLDGASTFRIYINIVIPSIRPGVVVLGLFAFMFSWNDILWPLIVLNDPSNQTVQVALEQLQDQAYVTDFGVQMNGTALATLPLLLIFLFVGRHLVDGVMKGTGK